MPTEMTNQAAQTMPEPIAAMIEQVSSVESLIDDASRQYHDSTRWAEEPSVYDDRSSPTLQEAIDAGFNKLRDMLRDYAAALAQTAGVVLARGWFHSLPDEDDYEFHDDASGAGNNCDGCIRAMIVAAPAASGGERHPDALQDGTLSKSTAKRVEALAAASVSERARYTEQMVRDASGKAWEYMGDADVVPLGLALELVQALTQQRGAVPDARPTLQYDDEGNGEYNYNEGWNDCRSAMLSGTTPQPSADAVRELVKRWRDLSDESAEKATLIAAGNAVAYQSCADELESLLSGGSHA